MNFRETIIKKPAFGLIAAGGVLVVGIVIIFVQVGGHGAPPARDEAFFTIDDGKTWFADSATNIPPFEKNGQQAVRAYVYRTSDGKQFVNHLERFKPEAKQALQSPPKTDHNHKVSANLADVQSAYTAGREVKRPGDATWTSAANFRDAAQVTAIKCPQGATDAVPVEP